MNYKMGIHVGKALGYIVNLYPTIVSVVLELVQNSLDSNAKDIAVIIDHQKRDIKVRDDGEGISTEKFAEAISKVCDSLKGKDKLGQFGIGMLSPLGKCKEFDITSIPKGLNSGYNKWFFNSDRILKNGDLPEIPHSELNKAIFSRSGKAMKDKDVYNWRTQVNIREFKTDRGITTASVVELQRLISGRFSEAMKRLNASVLICIKDADGKTEKLTFKAAEFRGEKMKPVIYGEPATGQTYFEIYISPKMASGRKGEVSIGIKNDLFRIGFKDFAKSITDYIKPETLQMLTSGTFEGLIVSDKCSLHQNRKEFLEDDHLMNLAIHLDEWAKNYAQPAMVSMKDSQRDEWLQAVGSVAISMLESSIKNELPHLLAVVKSFKKGFLTVPRKEEGQDHKSKKASSPEKYAKQKGGHSSSPKESSEDIVMTVAGPHGQKRRLVSGSSTGLQFVYEELPGNDHHWEFDSETGILSFNMRSDIWERMERAGDRSLILYQEYVGIKALEMQLEPEVSRPYIFEFLQRELKSAGLFISGATALHPRRAKSEVGKKI